MLRQPTLDRLRELRLAGMVEALELQSRQPDLHQDLSFEERLGLLVDYEWTYRRNRRLARLLRDAHLRLPASMEDVDYRHPRGLERSVLRGLATDDWIRNHQNVLLTGPTGVGKTYIVCALGNSACRHGFSVRYYRVPRLMAEMASARGDGNYQRILDQLARVEVLILDDFGLEPLAGRESRDLLELIDDRTQTRSTVVSSQLPIDRWHGTLADPTVADAILDRLVHTAHKLVLNGESMRKGTETA